MAPGALKPAQLRCEYRVDPLGIDVRRPRLSWIVESDRRCQRQTAYRVLVAADADDLAAGRGTLWDSGKVASDQTLHVVYGGRRLRSRMRCFWKVRVWDAAGRPSAWGPPARWTMGLLSQADWRAEWIGFDAPALAARPDRSGLILPPPRYLRKTFALARRPRRATVYATALGLYELRINGRKVGQDWLTPGWTDYDTRVHYQTYDVTDLLAEGENVIGAILADGWYAGYVGFQRGRRRELYGRRTRLRAQLHVEHASGGREVVVTDRTWRAATGPLLAADLLMGEAYDARRAMPGWDAPGFDASGWHRVNVTRRVGARVQAHPGVPVRMLAEVRPVGVAEPRKGRFVFDLGQNIAGVVRLRVAAGRGGGRGKKVVLRFGERLKGDGTVYTANLRTARAIDTYTCRGDGGDETWRPRFTYHGFQYVEVRGYPGTPPIDAVTGLALGSDTPAAGRFECSDATANRLHRNIRWTRRANFIEVPTDCPQRDERMGWTGDAQIFLATAAFGADVAAFFTKWLADVADAQLPGGAFAHIAPRRPLDGGGAAAWADAGVICPWTLWRFYGDEQLLRRHYRSMARFIDYCRRDSQGLLRPAVGFGDWLNVAAETPKDVLATAYFARSTHLLAEIADALDRQADAAKYRRLFARIARALNEAYVAADGRIAGDTQTAYVLALAFDLLPPEQCERALGRLIDDIERRGGHLSTGIVGTKDLMDVLTRFGRLDVAWRLFHNDAFPSWGFPIRHGATTVWERWDGWTPERGFQTPRMNSFSHYALGSVGQWMFRTIGGINAAAPGFKRIVIRPRPDGGTKLRWAKVCYHSIRGTIATAWKRTGGRLALDVTIPANTTAVVHVPAADPRAVTESGRPAGRAHGVRFLRMTDGAAVYQVGSGEYRFVSRPGAAAGRARDGMGTEQ